MVRFEQGAEQLERPGEIGVAHVGENRLELGTLVGGEIALEQMAVTVEQCRDLAEHLGANLGEIAALAVGERDEHHGHRTLQTTHPLALPNLEVAEQELAGFGKIGREEALDRAQVERLAESPRTADERHGVGRLPPAGDKVRLVDIEVAVLSDIDEPLRAQTDGPWHGVTSRTPRRPTGRAKASYAKQATQSKLR